MWSRETDRPHNVIVMVSPGEHEFAASLIGAPCDDPLIAPKSPIHAPLSHGLCIPRAAFEPEHDTPILASFRPSRDFFSGGLREPRSSKVEG